MWKLKVGEGGGGGWLMSVNNHVGRQHWEFEADAGTAEERAEVEALRRRFSANRFVQKQSSDALMRMQMRKENGGRKAIPQQSEEEEVTEEEAVRSALQRGLEYLCSIQAHDGHWPAESAGPLYYMPPLIMALYITGALHTALSSHHHMEMKRYIYNHQNEDGGWGLHIEANSCMFCSVLNYVALRLLGDGLQNDAVSQARIWILDHGGATNIPFWGKFYLSVLGLYEWEGCNPLVPESILCPRLFPIHLGKMTCYCRLTYLPMSYLYGKRFVAKFTPLIQQLREELYTQPYHQINWNLARTSCAKEDKYYEHSLIQDVLWGFLYHVSEPILKIWPFSKIRENAIKIVMEHIHYEDINSRYLTIGSIEKVLCLLACWVEDPNSEAYRYHLARITDYIWIAEDGMKVQGLAPQLWEATFSIQAIMSSNSAEEYGNTLRKAHEFVKVSQIKENPSGDFEKMYRHKSKGGWGLSIHDHGWQVSDCTAEGIKVALLLSQMPNYLVGEKMETRRLYDAVNFILTMQSKSGGFSAWEPKRGYYWLENFNPTDFYEDVLVERDHIECTSSAIQSLVLFKKLHPTYRTQEVEYCIETSIQYIINNQNPNGSWRGDWGICFLYGTWFAVDALVAMGVTYNTCPALRKACEFLLSKQLPDGGWGESYLSCTKKEYTNIEGNRSNLVQTSWALLALIKAGQVNIDPTPLKKSVKLLISSQIKDDGDFPQQENTGMFYKTNAMSYSTFRNIFPTWALAEYKKCITNT